MSWHYCSEVQESTQHGDAFSRCDTPPVLQVEQAGELLTPHSEPPASPRLTTRAQCIYQSRLSFASALSILQGRALALSQMTLSQNLSLAISRLQCLW